MPSSNKITMKEIAQLSGVAKSTVSRYFNGGYVKEETRNKIAQVIDRYHYEPNTFARLKAKESRMIGVIAPCLDSVVTGQVLMSIDRNLRQQGYDTLILNTDHNAQLELQYIEKLSRMNVDGLILSATQLSEAHIDALTKIEVPVVVLAQHYRQGVCIVNDDYDGGRFIGRTIGKCKPKHLACLCVEQWDEAIGIIRKQGILDGLKEEGIEDITLCTSDFSFEHAYQKVLELLEKEPIDALICSTDRQAMGAYKAIREKGWKIPEDISVISFGGYETSELLTPKLATIRFDTEYSGRCCAKTILDMIQAKEVPTIQYIHYEWVEGESIPKL